MGKLTIDLSPKTHMYISTGFGILYAIVAIVTWVLLSKVKTPAPEDESDEAKKQGRDRIIYIVVGSIFSALALYQFGKFLWVFRKHRNPTIHSMNKDDQFFDLEGKHVVHQ